MWLVNIALRRPIMIVVLVVGIMLCSLLAYERMSAERKARVRQRRYIAVPTVRERDSTGQQSVMVFDTQSQQVIGNNVYDVKTAPRDGQVSRFDTYNAEYVGAGT